MNQLFFGDNLHVLRDHLANESVDLIYLDPPFNSKRDYNLLFKSPTRAVGVKFGCVGTRTQLGTGMDTDTFAVAISVMW